MRGSWAEGIYSRRPRPELHRICHQRRVRISFSKKDTLWLGLSLCKPILYASRIATDISVVDVSESGAAN